jgi:hypothetical protein
MMLTTFNTLCQWMHPEWFTTVTQHGSCEHITIFSYALQMLFCVLTIFNTAAHSLSIQNTTTSSNSTQSAAALRPDLLAAAAALLLSVCRGEQSQL